MLRLALRLLARDWRGGELRLLGLALVLAVASVSSVGHFAARIDKALTLGAHQLLGADLVLVSDHPVAPETAARAVQSGLATSASVSFPSMARAGERGQLVGVKAVAPGYPLRGSLRVTPAMGASDAATRDIPAQGTVWIDAQLAGALQLQPGGRIKLGTREFTVSALLTLEPERGAGFFNIAPRLLLRFDDLESTRLLQAGSRATYRRYFSGEADAVAAFARDLELRLERGQALESLAGARPETRLTLERARSFLGLASLVAVVLAGVAVAMAARRYLARHYDGFAVLRCLGARQGQLGRLLLAEFSLFGLAASLLGALAGYGAHLVLVGLLGRWVDLDLPSAGLLPYVQGVIGGLALLIGFALPPLMQLRRVTPLRVLRREWAAPDAAGFGVWSAAFCVLAAMVFWQAGSAKLGAYAVAGFTLSLLLFHLAGWGALRLLTLWPGHGVAHLGLAALRRRGMATLAQITALSLGLCALLLVSFVQDGLLASWQRAVPADAPNRFLINVQPEQREALRRFFVDSELAAPELFPMVRGRLLAINERPVSAAAYAGDERAQRLVEREFNLSWAQRVPGENRIVAGRWPAPGDAPAFSVETGIARTLGIRLGDVLHYEVAGTRLAAPVTSLRKLEWDSMRVNFFVVASPGLLESQPATYITSFHLPQEAGSFATRVLERFPNLTLIDVGAMLGQARAMIADMVRAVEAVFAFALFAGLAVLQAALAATHDERLREAALMRTLGASSGQLRRALLAEFAALGALSGLLAAVAATAIGAAIGRAVFDLEYHPAWWIFPVSMAGGAMLVVGAGWAGSRRLFAQPPLAVLREA